MKILKRIIACLILGPFVLAQIPSAYAGEVAPWMPPAGTAVSLSAKFEPAIMVGLQIDAQNPFRFNFLIERSENPLSEESKRDEYRKLVKYFLASLTTPNTDMWVNLSPFEHDRIIPDDFGQTEMGRDLLAQDYLLKQITSSLIHPDTGAAKQFWDKVYEKAFEKYGTTDIPLDTFNKVWIVPDNATILYQYDTALVVQSHLKVMMEQDYLALAKSSDPSRTSSQPSSSPNSVRTTQFASDVVREIVIPLLEREVNEGANFAPLRQVYSSMLLATWFKKTLKESLLGQVYADRSKTLGIKLDDPNENESIYQRYLAAYKTGVFNMVKEDLDPITQELIPRKYFSGGTRAYTLDQAQVVSADQLTSRQKDYAGQVASKIDKTAVLLANVRADSTTPAGRSVAKTRNADDMAQQSIVTRQGIPLYFKDVEAPLATKYKELYDAMLDSAPLRAEMLKMAGLTNEDFTLQRLSIGGIGTNKDVVVEDGAINGQDKNARIGLRFYKAKYGMTVSKADQKAREEVASLQRKVSNGGGGIKVYGYISISDWFEQSKDANLYSLFLEAGIAGFSVGEYIEAARVSPSEELTEVISALIRNWFSDRRPDDTLRYGWVGPVIEDLKADNVIVDGSESAGKKGKVLDSGGEVNRPFFSLLNKLRETLDESILTAGSARQSMESLFNGITIGVESVVVNILSADGRNAADKLAQIQEVEQVLSQETGHPDMVPLFSKLAALVRQARDLVNQDGSINARFAGMDTAALLTAFHSYMQGQAATSILEVLKALPDSSPRGSDLAQTKQIKLLTERVPLTTTASLEVLKNMNPNVPEAVLADVPKISVELSAGMDVRDVEMVKREVLKIVPLERRERFKESMGLLFGTVEGNNYRISRIVQVGKYETQTDIWVAPDRQEVARLIRQNATGETLLLGAYHTHYSQPLLSNKRPGPSAFDRFGDDIILPAFSDRIVSQPIGIVFEPQLDLADLDISDAGVVLPTDINMFVYINNPNNQSGVINISSESSMQMLERLRPQIDAAQNQTSDNPVISPQFDAFLRSQSLDPSKIRMIAIPDKLASFVRTAVPKLLTNGYAGSVSRDDANHVHVLVDPVELSALQKEGIRDPQAILERAQNISFLFHTRELTGNPSDYGNARRNIVARLGEDLVPTAGRTPSTTLRFSDLGLSDLGVMYFGYLSEGKAELGLFFKPSHLTRAEEEGERVPIIQESSFDLFQVLRRTSAAERTTNVYTWSSQVNGVQNLDELVAVIEQNVGGTLTSDDVAFLRRNYSFPADAAQKTDNTRFNPGGIDLNDNLLNLNIKRDGAGIPLPLPDQDPSLMQIEGLLPRILEITPAQSLPIFSGLKQS